MTEKETMTTKEIRKRILEEIYNADNREFFNTEQLEFLRKGVGDRVLDNEIKYLEGKGYIEIVGKYMGKKFLNYIALKLTSYGIDLVEDPEEFSRLFSLEVNNFGDVTGSNIVINSPNSRVEINKDLLNKEAVELLKDLKDAVEKGNAGKSSKILSQIGNISKDLLIGIVSNGIYEVIKKAGLLI